MGTELVGGGASAGWGRMVSEAGNAEEPPGSCTSPPKAASPAHSILGQVLATTFRLLQWWSRLARNPYQIMDAKHQNPYNLDTLKVYNLKLWRRSNKIKRSATTACRRTAPSTQSTRLQSVRSSPGSQRSWPLGPHVSSSGASGEHLRVLSLFFHLPCTLSTSTFYLPLPGIS